MIDFGPWAGRRFCWGFAWCWLDQHADAEGRIDGSLAEWATVWSWPKSNVVTFLDAMQVEGRIKIEGRTKGRSGRTFIRVMKSTTSTDLLDGTRTNTRTKNEGGEKPSDQMKIALDHYAACADRYGWAKVRGPLSRERSAKLRQRLKDHGIEGWDEALRNACRSPYLRGEKNGFRLSLDFLLQPSSLQKVLEGAYAENARPAQGGQTAGPSWRGLSDGW